MLLRGIGSTAVLAGAILVSACSASVTPAQVGPARDGLQNSRSQIAAETPDLPNLLKDGSFETPLVPVGGFTVFNVGSTFSKWTVTGPGGDVGIVSGTFTQNGFSFPAGCGNQFIDLTGIETLGNGVQQTITTVMGSQHALSFSVGNVVDPNGIFGTTSTVKVYVNDVHVFSAKNKKGAGGTVQVWKAFTTTITAPSTRTTIRFSNGDPPGDDNNGLDCIKLN
ncbi:MAG TPA: DUF642 domain-containing protein [Candidatus Eremiobacteraceae bacterium]